MATKSIPKADDELCDPGEGTTLVPVGANAAEFLKGTAAPTPQGRKTDDEARLGEIRQMFEGKAMSYFTMAERALEYHDIFTKRDFAQNAQKSKRGRPGVVTAMARELAVPGNSEAAKRAWIERALKVAQMSPEAVDAAKKAKLERNRSALIEVAAAGSAAEQVQMIEQITERKAKQKKNAKFFVTKTVRIPVARGDEIFEKLIAFAEEHGVTVD